MNDSKTRLRLIQYLDEKNNISKTGITRLIDAVNEAADLAKATKCKEIMALATSAVRDAANSDEVLARVTEETGVELRVLSGEDEARMTFLAARRWYGWSAGRILNLEIGGRALERNRGKNALAER